MTTTQSFPLQSGYNNRVANGHTEKYTISGSCRGSASYVRSPPTAATFKGAPALAVVATDTVTYSECTGTSGTSPGTRTTTGTAYYDTGYAYLGVNSPGNYYGLMETPTIVPASIKVGDSGVLGIENIYLDESHQFQIGKNETRYVVEPDTANTVIINEIVESYKVNSTGYTWTMTRQERFRVASNGSLTPVSLDAQSQTSAEHLIFTAQ